MNELHIKETNTQEQQINALQKIIDNSDALGITALFTCSNKTNCTLTLDTDTINSIINHLENKQMNGANANNTADSVYLFKFQVMNCSFNTSIIETVFDYSTDIVIIPSTIKLDGNTLTFICYSYSNTISDKSIIDILLPMINIDANTCNSCNIVTSFDKCLYLYNDNLVTLGDLQDEYFDNVESNYNSYTIENYNFEDWIDTLLESNQLYNVVFLN